MRCWNLWSKYTSRSLFMKPNIPYKKKRKECAATLPNIRWLNGISSFLANPKCDGKTRDFLLYISEPLKKEQAGIRLRNMSVHRKLAYFERGGTGTIVPNLFLHFKFHSQHMLLLQIVLFMNTLLFLWGNIYHAGRCQSDWYATRINKELLSQSTP